MKDEQFQQQKFQHKPPPKVARDKEEEVFKLIEVFPKDLSRLPSQQWKGIRSHQRMAVRVRQELGIRSSLPLTVYGVAQYNRVSARYMFRFLFPKRPYPETGKP